ncbi:hypothetical protein ACLMAL_23780 [Nocardia sp. CWNU-33]|uniref:hypothetical protein n=1 Tax=Nocardia sp. CWNU-33 TaxID=3392117 RepID=UPI00398E3A9C
MTTETSVSGQQATYSFDMVETHGALMDTLGLSMQASGRYGIFSAEGKFALPEKSSYNSQSTMATAYWKALAHIMRVNGMSVSQYPLASPRRTAMTSRGA